jgi:hypothetical protein
MKYHHGAGAMLRYRNSSSAAISQPGKCDHSLRRRLQEFNQY